MECGAPSQAGILPQIFYEQNGSPFEEYDNE